MKSRMSNVLWTVLTLVLLCAFALAVPLGSLKEEAHFAYLDEAPVSEDDEYAFLFDE